MENKRQAKRLDFKLFSGFQVTFKQGNETLPGIEITDISETGIKLSSKSPMISPISIRIDIPSDYFQKPSKINHIEANANLVWTRLLSSENKYLHGFRFDMGERHKDVLVKMIKRQLEMLPKKSLKRRPFERPSTNLAINIPINIAPSFLSKNTNNDTELISDTFKTPFLISQAKTAVRLLSKQGIKTNLNVVWSKNLLERHNLKYAVAFIRFKEKEIEILTQLMIESEVSEMLKECEDLDLRNRIYDFWTKEFKVYLRDLDKLCSQIQKEADISYSKTLELEKLNNDIISKGNELTSTISDHKIVKKFKKLFRSIGGGWYFRSHIMNKGFLKLQGYPGDFEMMNYVYNNSSVSPDILGRYFDRYFLDNPYAVAVRGRKDRMLQILKKMLPSKSGTEMNILNIACGPCRDIKEYVTKNPVFKSRVNFTCVDQDKDALKYSEKSLLPMPSNTTAKFSEGNILDFVKNEELYQKKLGKYELVYSLGLADYLPDKLLKRLIHFSWGLVKPKGTFIIAHKIKEKCPFAPLPPDWFCDWHFVPRSIKDLMTLVKKSGIKSYTVETEWDLSDTIIFLIIRKEA